MLKKLLIISLLFFTIEGFSQTQQISAGDQHILFSCTNGDVQSCGNNWFGELGDGTSYTSKRLAGFISNFSGVTSISAGVGFSLFLKNDGTVWGCGSNGSGELGNGNYSSARIPVQVNNLSGITSISAGLSHSLFLKNDGTVWACGKNDNGQLGDGTGTDRSIPVQVSNLTNIVSISNGGNHSLFLKSDGTVWACGNNIYGELGNGTYSNAHIPVQVNNLTGITYVSAGHDYSLFLKNDGTVWACGVNSNGQLGDGTNEDKNIPVRVKNALFITAISAGKEHSLFIKNNGTVLACGSNLFGQLGDGTNTSRNKPVQVPNLTGITTIDAGNGFSLFLKNDGTVLACGSCGGAIQMGNPGSGSSKTPVQITSCFTPTPPQVDFSSFPSSLCLGSNISVDPSIAGSNPEPNYSVDNSIVLTAPKSICRNSQAVFILQDNNEIKRFAFDGTLQYTYNTGAVLLDSINAITVDENNNVWAQAGDYQSFFYRLTPAGTIDNTLDVAFYSGNAQAMLLIPNGYATDDLFVLNDSVLFTSIDVDNTDPFSNANYQAGFSPAKVTSITYDNKLYPEKRLIFADPVNNKIWSRELYVTSGNLDTRLLVDSNATAGLAIDFVYADTTSGFIYASSKSTGKLAVMYTYVDPNGTVTTSFDTLSQSIVSAQTPVGMIQVPKGSMWEFWIADRGQNKLIRVSNHIYTITPPLPTGLKFNIYSGRIEGTPVNPSSPQTYQVIVQNGLGTDTTYVTFGVNPASNVSNNTGSSNSTGNQEDGLTIKYYDLNNCSRLLEIADSLGGTSPGQTQITQTTYPLVGVIANDSLIRRVNSIRAENMDALKVNIKLFYTYDDINLFNQTRGSALLSNDTIGGTMQMAVLQMHDKPDGSKEPIIHSPVTANWSTTNHHWAVTVPVTKFSDFYGSDMGTLNSFNCTNAGSQTLTINSGYYVWNDDTLFTSGIYKDSLINKTGCDSIATLDLTLLTIGVSELSSNGNFAVFPNPNNGILTIAVNGKTIKPKSVRIMNVIGNEVYYKQLSSTTTLDITHFDAGIYFVIIETEDKPYVQRIVKE